MGRAVRVPKTRTFRLNKLVHDGIVGFNEAFGATVDYDVLSEEDLRKALETKLLEEQTEFEHAKTDEEKTKEQGDVNDILYALGRLDSTDYLPNHTFAKGHFVNTIALPLDNEEGRYWADYYSSQPDRFTELNRTRNL